MTTSSSPPVLELQNYPSPIAATYDEMLSIGHIQLQFRMLIKVFSGTLKYSALIVISDYLRLREHGTVRSADLDALFVEKIERPSLGHWNNFLRDILAASREKKADLFAPELFDFYYDCSPGRKLKTTRSVERINRLINLRNRYVHPDIFRPDDETQLLYRQAKGELDALLHELCFLENYLLIRYSEGDRKGEVCQGVRPASTFTDVQQVQFSLRCQSRPGPELSLGSFFCFPKDKAEREYDTALYESLVGKKIMYVLGNYVTVAESSKSAPGPVERMRTTIDALAASLDSVIRSDVQRGKAETVGEGLVRGLLDWDSFRSLATNVSEDTFGRFLREKKFEAALYIERGALNKEIESFLPSNQRGFILVAESGLGKTNLFCQWGAKLAAEGHAALLLCGRDYEGGKIEDMVLRELLLKEVLLSKHFHGDLFQLLAILAADQEVAGERKQFVLLVDGVNESSKSEELLGHLLTFIESIPYPWLKVLFSIRTYVWESLGGKYILDREVFQHMIDPSGKLVPYISLGMFTDKELEEAYGRYQQRHNLKSGFGGFSPQTRRLLRNPLLLRFAAEAYHDAALPPNVFTNEIFEQYKQERIHTDDHFFLEYLSEAMWRTKSDELPLGMIVRHDSSLTASEFQSPSVMNQTGPVLTEKLMEYIFEDPVYEKSLVPVCTFRGCPQEGRDILGILPGAIQERSTAECPLCGKPGGTKEVDFRTTYYRLCSENILQEFTRGDDTAIRFTYDRMFEFFMGEFIGNHVLSDLPRKGPVALLNTAERIRSTFVFWGALKNVVVSLLRANELSDGFWMDMVTLSGRGNSREVAAGADAIQTHETAFAFKQIFCSALEEYSMENRDRVLSILCTLTEPGRATPDSVSVALESTQRILSISGPVSYRSREFESIRRGLRSAYGTARYEATRILTAFYASSKNTVLESMEELANDIMSALQLHRLPGLLLPGLRNRLLGNVDSLSQLVLSILGTHFSEEDARTRILSIGVRLIRSPLFFILKGALRRVIPSKLATAYWEKGPLPCNYLEMHLGIQAGLSSNAREIGKWFVEDDLRLVEQPSLFDTCQMENGLISWYMYSLFPVYAQRPDQTEEVLHFLKDLFDRGNHVSRYIAQKSLWILAQFSPVRPELFRPAFEECTLRMLERDGAFLTYSHAYREDETIKRYLEEKTSDGLRRAHWACEKEGRLVIQYDNTALMCYAEYLLRTNDPSRFEFLIELLEEKGWKNDRVLVCYALRTLGRLGTMSQPGPALKTLQYILEHLLQEDAPVSFEGRTTTELQILTDVLLEIKSFYPSQVNHFVESLEHKDHVRLRKVLVSKVDRQLDYLDSYYGELIYQKTFLTSNEIRGLFGRGILRASEVQTVDNLFRAFVVEFLRWSDTLHHATVKGT
jgi:hypothetical protein